MKKLNLNSDEITLIISFESQKVETFKCKKNDTLIEHSLFVDLIALMALEMNYPSPEPSPFEKLLIFIEKIKRLLLMILQLV